MVIDTFVLSNAKILVGDGTVIDNGSILIEGGKITAIQAGKIPAPNNSATLDLGGRIRFARFGSSAGTRSLPRARC